ncbi:beta-propeller fold lactonase family protein, partial [Vibrio rotiferianus]
MEVSNSLRFFVGTYTDSLSKGIESISLDTATGQLSSHSTLLNTSNPSYLHLTKNGLYSFNEVEEVEGA